MGKIAFIAPDKHLYIQGKKIIRELGIEKKTTIYLARLNRAVRLARKLQHEETDVIVCRGGTASLLKELNINVPIVEVPITGQDLAQVFHEAKQLSNSFTPKVAILAFQNMIYDIEILSDILDIKLSIYPIEKPEDIPLKIKNIPANNVDIVVGGIKSTILAEKQGFKTIRITSGDYSIQSALLEAEKILLARKIEKERSQKFKALIDYSVQGIISVDRKKIVNVFNPTAERLLHISSENVLGKEFDSSLNFLDVDECLSKGTESIGQVIQFRNVWLTCNMAPIIVDNHIVGAMITFQDITQIQELEAKIRNQVTKRKLDAKYVFSDLIGSSKEIKETKRIAKEIAAVDTTVLISGETGTGKELFAQSIHNSSSRKNGPFVAINCAALPPNLLESELFGYVEGAFTGASKKGKPGLFEMAHQGTIFLDEISEMDQYGQSRLLRVLQEKQVMRLGDDKYLPIDVRIIAATNKNLRKLINEGEFREDLLYRLKVLTVNIPSLRKRKTDVNDLCQHFLSFYSKQHNKEVTITPSGLEKLKEYQWPGNVRELGHFIERLTVIAKEKSITDYEIGKYLEGNEFDLVNNDVSSLTDIESEKDRIVEALTRCNSNISQAAKLLQIDRSTLYRKLNKYNIEVKKSY
ncbi:sigma 54-interacting transcriptional regulator [Thalassorhabdus alkalitolerans]|uniref:Sigma 54-interacting transcriptional regulator n=1 Tax=Thalassorhabdus alkalitolerans TaxID=2282697 RepID=A0ABW0YPH6_9BACI